MLPAVGTRSTCLETTKGNYGTMHPFLTFIRIQERNEIPYVHERGFHEVSSSVPGRKQTSTQ